MRIPKYLYILLLALLLLSCGSEDREQLKVGDRAPLFSVADLDGQAVDMTSYAGSPVVLRFWSTDCKYCRADTPIFNSYFEKYRKAGLKVVYINSTADIATVRDFVQDLEIVFPVVLDKDGAIAEMYEVKLTPVTIFISPDRKILAAVLGGVGEAEFQDILGQYLNR